MVNSIDILKERVVRDGKVAVLVSKGTGAGWYSWHRIPELLFDPIVINMVLEERFDEIESYLEKNYKEQDPYTGGIDGLTVEWIPQGVKFQVLEYDGAESILTTEDPNWIVA